MNTSEMQAVVYTAPGELTFYPRHAMARDASPDDVLVRVDAAGICGSDMHAFHGHDARRQPGIILGHEFCGTVVGGEHSNGLQGKRVTANPLITCGVCAFCREGRDNLCSDRDMIGMNKPGAFAQYLYAPKRCLVLAPEHMPAEHVALTEPAATVLHAINLSRRVARRPLEELRVLVIGGGAIGLLAALYLRHHGVEAAILETNEKRHANITAHTGYEVINPLVRPVAKKHFHLALDCVGSAKTRATAFEAVAIGGIITHIGLQDFASEIDMRGLTLQEITLLGCYTYTMAEFRDALNLIHRGVFGDLSWLLPRPLREANEVFHQLDSGDISSAKVVLKP